MKQRLTKAQQEVLDIVREKGSFGVDIKSIAILRYQRRGSKSPYYMLPTHRAKPIVVGTARTVETLVQMGLVEPFGAGYGGAQYRATERVVASDS